MSTRTSSGNLRHPSPALFFDLQDPFCFSKVLDLDHNDTGRLGDELAAESELNRLVGVVLRVLRVEVLRRRDSKELELRVEAREGLLVFSIRAWLEEERAIG